MVGRSLERVSFQCDGIAAGEVVVAGRFDHPRRGIVDCPAASLLAEIFREHGFRVRIADLHTTAAEIGNGESVVCTMSYLDHDGGPVGLGVATRTPAEPAAALGRDLIERWSSVVRTRRVLVAVSETDVDDGWTVASVAAAVRAFAQRGDTVLVIGSPGSAASVISCAGQATVRVIAPGRTWPLTGIDPDRVSYVVAPGTPIEDAAEVVKLLRHRFPRLRGPHPREFCYAASDRRETVRSVAAAGNVVLVCDPEGEQAGDELLGWAGERACPAHRVSRLSDLRSEWLGGAATVGVAVASPAGMPLAGELVTMLSGLGPLAAVRRRVVTEPFPHARTALHHVDDGVMASRDRMGHAALVRHGSVALCVTDRARA